MPLAGAKFIKNTLRLASTRRGGVLAGASKPELIIGVYIYYHEYFLPISVCIENILRLEGNIV